MIKTPDEGRARFNLAPTGGGNTLWGQHQDYPLGMLSKRTDLDPVDPPAPDPRPAPVSEEDQTAIDQAKAIVASHKAITGLQKRMALEAMNA